MPLTFKVLKEYLNNLPKNWDTYIIGIKNPETEMNGFIESTDHIVKVSPKLFEEDSEFDQERHNKIEISWGRTPDPQRALRINALNEVLANEIDLNRFDATEDILADPNLVNQIAHIVAGALSNSFRGTVNVTQGLMHRILTTPDPQINGTIIEDMLRHMDYAPKRPSNLLSEMVTRFRERINAEALQRFIDDLPEQYRQYTQKTPTPE